MLCVRPCSDEQYKEQVLLDLGLSGDSTELLTAEENGRILGYAAVKPQGLELEILSLSIADCADYSAPNDDNMEIAEYLIRAVGNYAYNRMIPALSCVLPELDAILIRLGFEKIDNLSRINIKKLFNSCKSCE